MQTSEDALSRCGCCGLAIIEQDAFVLFDPGPRSADMPVRLHEGCYKLYRGGDLMPYTEDGKRHISELVEYVPPTVTQWESRHMRWSIGVYWRLWDRYEELDITLPPFPVREYMNATDYKAASDERSAHLDKLARVQRLIDAWEDRDVRIAAKSKTLE